MTTRKVAVVGMGGVFPTCKDLSEFNSKLFSNQSLIRNWEEAQQYGKQVRSTVSGYVTPEEMHLKVNWSETLEAYPESFSDTLGRIPEENLATSDIGCIWAMLAAQDVIRMAGWSVAELESEQMGVVIGSGGGGNTILRNGWHNFYVNGIKTRYIGGSMVARAMSFREAANVSTLIKNKGVCESLASACATGLGNIGHAYRLIKFGFQDRVIAGGVENTSLESFLGFDAMMVLSRGLAPEESSRPFDTQRNGFVCSFGAGIVALEALDQAIARGAEILGVIDEYFSNADGDGNMYHPSFDGQQRLWKGLLAGAPGKPDVVKVHGTSTVSGDPIELFSTVSILGNEGYHISAPKSQYGHMLGAAGAVEFITSLLMLKAQKVSPCLNANNLNEDLEPCQRKSDWTGPLEPMAAYRDLLPQQSFSKPINSIVCLNYGFGGTNSAMKLSKYAP